MESLKTPREIVASFRDDTGIAGGKFETKTGPLRPAIDSNNRPSFQIDLSNENSPRNSPVVISGRSDEKNLSPVENYSVPNDVMTESINSLKPGMDCGWGKKTLRHRKIEGKYTMSNGILVTHV